MLTDFVGCLDGGEDRRFAILEQWTAWNIMLERPTTLCKYPSGESIHWKKLAVFFFGGGMWGNDKVNLAPFWYIRETSSLNLTRSLSHRKQLYTRFTGFCPWKNCNAIHKSIHQGPFFHFLHHPIQPTPLFPGSPGWKFGVSSALLLREWLHWRGEFQGRSGISKVIWYEKHYPKPPHLSWFFRGKWGP